MPPRRAPRANDPPTSSSTSEGRPSRSRRAPDRFAPAEGTSTTTGVDGALVAINSPPTGPKSKSKKTKATPAQAPAVKRVRRTADAPPADMTVDDETNEGFVVLPPPSSTPPVTNVADATNPALEALAARFAAPPPSTNALLHSPSEDTATLAGLAAQVAALAAAVTALTNTAATDRATAQVSTKPFSLPVELTNAPSFTSPEHSRAKIKGGYYPPEDHVFRAQRLFKVLHSPEGKSISPHSVALMLCCQAKFPFRTSPALAMAQFSGRLGSLGASVMCFRFRGQRQSLRHNSANHNMTLSFDPSASLPADSCTPCEHLNHLSDAVDGLANFADVYWFQYTQSLFSALRRFVSAVKANEDRAQQRVTDLAVDFVNKWLGDALDALGSDSPTWWTDYQAVIDGISATSSEYLVAYIQVTSVHRQSEASARGQALSGSKAAPPSTSAGSGSGQPYQPMPEQIKALIPKNATGEEPCLRRMTGKTCNTTCSRTHDWDIGRDGPVDPALLAWAKQNLVDRRFNSFKPRHRGRRT